MAEAASAVRSGAATRAGEGLEVRRLAVSYGRHRALKGVDLAVAPGEIVVILGANGAGKTSLLKAIAGIQASEPGSQLRLDGQPLAARPPHRIVEAGLALVPEGRGIFGDLTVRENLLLGAYAERARPDQAANLERVLALFPRLAERSAQQARTMSGGEQQMVAIGRALMSAPRILMLDEPSLGLSPLLCTELFRTLKTVRGAGVGILLVEQNARQSLAIADRAYLLENGEIVGQGPAEQLARDPAVQAAYLGGAAGHATAPGAVKLAPGAVKPAPGAAPVPSAAAPAASPARATSSMTAGAPSPAAIAAQALAAVTTGPAALVPAAPSATSTPADALVPTHIAELVRIAAQRQADDVIARRGPAGAAGGAVWAARAADELRRSGTLDDAMAGIEAAAAGARVAAGATAPRGPQAPRPGAMPPARADAAPAPAAWPPAPTTGPAKPAAGPLPAIEIWRRPGVEVWCRRADGQMTKES